MTTITIDGPITAIITTPDEELSSLTCGDGSTTRTEISRLARRTIVLGSYVGPANNGPIGFQIGSGFAIGDIIEYYGTQPISLPQPGAPFSIRDEIGNDMIAGHTNFTGTIFRKISDADSGILWVHTTS